MEKRSNHDEYLRRKALVERIAERNRALMARRFPILNADPHKFRSNAELDAILKSSSIDTPFTAPKKGKVKP